MVSPFLKQVHLPLHYILLVYWVFNLIGLLFVHPVRISFLFDCLCWTCWRVSGGYWGCVWSVRTLFRKRGDPLFPTFSVTRPGQFLFVGTLLMISLHNWILVFLNLYIFHLFSFEDNIPNWHSYGEHKLLETQKLWKSKHWHSVNSTNTYLVICSFLSLCTVHIKKILKCGVLYSFNRKQNIGICLKIVNSEYLRHPF